LRRCGCRRHCPHLLDLLSSILDAYHLTAVVGSAYLEHRVSRLIGFRWLPPHSIVPLFFSSCSTNIKYADCSSIFSACHNFLLMFGQQTEKHLFDRRFALRCGAQCVVHPPLIVLLPFICFQSKFRCPGPAFIYNTHLMSCC